MLAAVAMAWSLLTIVPAPRVATDLGAAARSTAFFPLVGAVLGLALGGVGLALDAVLPPGPVAALLLVLGALLTGALHLDGLMDTADGLFGGRNPERRLEIMRDSHVGAFGVAAAGLAILFQFASLAELTGHERLVALVAALVLGRCGMAVALGLGRPARANGLAARYQAGGLRWPAVAATALAMAVAVATWPIGVAGFVAATVATAGALALSRGLIGGVTGDVCGALCVVVECVVLLLAVALR